ncbi:CBS domain-containing protein [Methanocalculus taiwanensis]|uniref:CBS domain-containing protein n=1 Tax=Methanocalculus taiwanensis TaxID=106207 RepID=A0ABD4TJX7_9EURY|nr:CBS domain-containing protein [Methanocalculus taiwanensis]MCQ1539233.1 CBS domain-containing protein [Methanocalculus taiwanensis]
MAQPDDDRSGRVRSIMTPIARTVLPDTPIRDLIEIGSVEGCGDIPVTTPEGTFLGVITPLDLIGSIMPSVGIRGSGAARCITCHLKKEGATARDLMSRGHITIQEDDFIMDAMQMMQRNRHGDLIVIDSQNKVVGRIEICRIIQHLRIVGEL